MRIIKVFFNEISNIISLNLDFIDRLVCYIYLLKYFLFKDILIILYFF